jgi:hypothetical protein
MSSARFNPSRATLRDSRWSSYNMFLFSYLFPPGPFSPPETPRPEYRTMRHLPDELILQIISCEHHHPSSAPRAPPLIPHQSSSQRISYACSSSRANFSTSPATTTSGSAYATSTPPPSADVAGSKLSEPTPISTLG